MTVGNYRQGSFDPGPQPLGAKALAARQRAAVSCVSCVSCVRRVCVVCVVCVLFASCLGVLLAAGCDVFGMFISLCALCVSNIVCYTIHASHRVSCVSGKFCMVACWLSQSIGARYLVD